MYKKILKLNKILKYKISDLMLKLLAPYRKMFLKNKQFTIISNNCFASLVYQRYNLIYQTPTIGTFIMPDDYIKLLKNLKYYLESPLVFISPNQSKYITVLENIDKWGHYPIARLDDIEIHFLHYTSSEEASLKWNKRLKRINWNRILVKFSQQNQCKELTLKEFETLNYKYKFCFVNQYLSDNPTFINLKECEQYEEITFDAERKYYNKYIHITKLLNSMLVDEV